MRTFKGLTTSAVALATLTVTACTPMTTRVGGATETALCDAWQDSLPTRSRSDTPQTIAEIGRAYDVFEAVCQRKVR